MSVTKYARFIWYYIVEMVFSGMFTFLLFLLLPESQTKNFLAKTVSDWLSVTGQVLFPASVAVLTVYANLSTGKFGEYLHKLGREKFYLHGFTWPVAIFALTTLCLIFFKGIDEAASFGALSWMTIYFLFWSGATGVTMIANLLQVVRLFRKFQLLLEEIEKR